MLDPWKFIILFVSLLAKSWDFSLCEAYSSIFSSYWKFLPASKFRGLNRPDMFLLFYKNCNFAFGTKHQVFKSMMKSVPLSSSLSTLTSPPIYSIMSLQILKPRPTPFVLLSLCSASLLKFKNKRLFAYSDIPHP